MLERSPCLHQKKAAEKKAAEAAKKTAIQVDDLLIFRQFSKKAADDIIDVGQPLVHLYQPLDPPPGTRRRQQGYWCRRGP